ncbi:hypothetical protein KOR34_00890 [Posidoniimonas corsicana]|uniref:Glycosyl transferase family 2 n=1 Tax=Posidoniimonas corsicana TaxID=1938618 RepID=A0A5C5VA75_9BACT|nr:glycosyltransferase family A protein [Posidoniimonas corsicana]TWT35201.1 hypothetical protein KOR34_00890 [Posidoniimonas corsicana]
MPKVSALMITGKSSHRRSLAEIAVRCFQRQTHSDRELIIVNTAPDAPWFTTQASGVHETALPRSDATLGELRNLSVQLARGEFVLQWDDDDWHHPHRMAWQVSKHSPGEMTILRRQYCLDAVTGEAGVIDGLDLKRDPKGIAGTVLCEPRSLHYPARARDEDTLALRGKPVNIVENEPSLYVRVYHGGNTWSRDHILGRITRPVPDQNFVERIGALYTPID